MAAAGAAYNQHAQRTRRAIPLPGASLWIVLLPTRIMTRREALNSAWRIRDFAVNWHLSRRQTATANANEIPCPEGRMTADADPAAIVDALARTAREVRTPCGDGSMVWRVWGAGEPLVLFHGGSGSWTHWIRNIPELSRHYQLWLADIPGLGDSTMPTHPWVHQ